MKLDILKTNIKYNNYLGLPFEIQFSYFSYLRLLNLRIKQGEIELPNFDKRRISQPKTQ